MCKCAMCKCGPAAYDFGAKSRAHFLDLVRIFEKLLFAHVHIWTYRYPPKFSNRHNGNAKLLANIRAVFLASKGLNTEACVSKTSASA